MTFLIFYGYFLIEMNVFENVEIENIVRVLQDTGFMIQDPGRSDLNILHPVSCIMDLVSCIMNLVFGLSV